MEKIEWSNLTKKHFLYSRFLYGVFFATVFLSRVSKLQTDTKYTIIACALPLICVLIGDIVIKIKKEPSAIAALFGLISFTVLEYYTPLDNFVMPAIIVLSAYLSIVYVVMDTEYDRSIIFARKLAVVVIVGLGAGISVGHREELEWLCYFVARFASVLLSFYVVELMVLENETLSKRITDLAVEVSNYEDANAELLEYQERIKEINEQINYQKIDLTRAYKELEQANAEVKSQTEIMYYMASTFDVQKYLNVIADAVMDVKNAKFCVIYVESDVYNNKYPSCMVKTNYSSMERRLKKEIEEIYLDIKEKDDNNKILDREAATNRFKFLGETNISMIAVLPLRYNKKIYGVMLVGSDQEEFFHNGLGYYENCIMEFGVALQTTKLYLRMEDMARKDGLTGIYNRIYFNELFSEAARNSAETKESLSVALFDIDKFKSVNDTYGHLAGDSVIKMVASMGQKYAEKYDGFACRYGGEEFLLVLPGKSQEEALPILEEMHGEIKETVVSHESTEITVNVCIGLSSYPEICDDPELLVSRADKAMYYGKKNGRGRLVLDNPSIDEE